MFQVAIFIYWFVSNMTGIKSCLSRWLRGNLCRYHFSIYCFLFIVDTVADGMLPSHFDITDGSRAFLYTGLLTWYIVGTLVVGSFHNIMFTVHRLHFEEFLLNFSKCHRNANGHNISITYDDHLGQ